MTMHANRGIPTHPGWCANLRADPQAHVEVEGRQFDVRAEELSPAAATRFRPRILAIAPDYAKYRQRTTRSIRLMRLIPIE